MPRAYHNLDGLMRDLRAACEAGEERFYEFGELVAEALDSVETSQDDDDASDTQSAGAGVGQDSLFEPDGSPRARTSADAVVRVEQDVDATAAGVVRVAGRESDQLHVPLAVPSGTGGGPAGGQSAVLNPVDRYEDAVQRGRR